RITETAYDAKRAADPLFTPPPAAVVYVLDPRRRSVPEALVKRCIETDIALLSVPPATSPRRVEEEALVGLVEAAAGDMDLLASVQRYLLTALGGPKPEREVLD